MPPLNDQQKGAAAAAPSLLCTDATMHHWIVGLGNSGASSTTIRLCFGLQWIGR